MSRGSVTLSGDLLARVEELRTDRTPFVLATVVRAERPTSARPGDRAVVLPDGRIEGFVGGACAESTVRLEGLRLLRDGTSTLLRITPSSGAGHSADPVEGLVSVDNPCLSGGTLEIFLEAVVPPTVVLVLGGGPVAQALERVGAVLDYDVRAADPAAPVPPDVAAVVVASHGHDEEALLAAALAAGVPYVALVASRRRGAAVLAGLDVSETDRSRVRTPAGLDIGARTPPEVALSIYADLVARRGHLVLSATVDHAALERARLDHDRPDPTGPPSSTAALDGGPAEAIDPVCGMTVARTSTSLTALVDGVTRWFCGPGCRQAFLDRHAPSDGEPP